MGAPSSYQDPHVAFSEAFSLFEYDRGTDVYRIAKHHHYFFGQQEFAATKSPGDFRAFCLGGSTVLGHPYETPTSFAKWAEIELNERDPARQFQFVNCGGMSYASYRLIPILEEVLQHEPDLIVVMTGHNEFLEDRTYKDFKRRSSTQKWIDEAAGASRLVTLARRALQSVQKESDEEPKSQLGLKVDALLDHSSGYASYRRDEAWWQGVTQHFELNVEVIVDLCKRANVPLILISPGSNLRDCPPFKSEHKSDLTTEESVRWEQLFADAEKLEFSEPQKALELYEQADAIDSQHAQLAFRIGRTLDQLGRFDEALLHYRRAKELDVCPLRMLDAMEQSLLRVANTTNTPILNARDVLRGAEANGELVGYDWYVDHVHPSIRGHQLIAEQLVAKLATDNLAQIQLPEPWSALDRRNAYAKQMTVLGDQFLLEARRRVEWLEGWARRDRLSDDVLPVDARGMLDYGHIATEFAEYEQAASVYKLLLQTSSDATEPILDRALQLFQSGRTAVAENLLLFLPERLEDPQSDEQAIAMAVLSLHQEKLNDAKRYASLVKTSNPTQNPRMNAWLTELPAASSLFEK